MDELKEEARGDALVDQLCYLGATLRDRVRDALHVGVKRAMAVVCSGFSYDMEVVSHGFVTDISKTDAENEEASRFDRQRGGPWGEAGQAI